MSSPVYNLPNLITVARFFLSACLALLLMLEQSTPVALAAWLVFTVAAASDWVDGYIARRDGLVTVFGKLMDPLADKILVTTALIMLIPNGRLPAWIALVILSREIMVTGLRGVASAAGTVVAASGLGKIKSTTQYVGLAILIFPLGILPLPALHQIGLVVMYLATILTLWSGLDYFYSLRKVILERDTE